MRLQFVAICLVVLALLPSVEPTIFEATALVLGVLPVSEIIATGGIIGLKLALAARILEYLGYRTNGTTPMATTPIPIPYAYSGIGNNGHGNAVYNTKADTTTVPSVAGYAASNESALYSGLSELFADLGFGGSPAKNLSTQEDTTLPPPAFSDSVFFPIPGLQIRYEEINGTTHGVYLFGNQTYTARIIPVNYSNYEDYWKPVNVSTASKLFGQPRTNLTTSKFPIDELLGSQSKSKHGILLFGFDNSTGNLTAIRILPAESNEVESLTTNSTTTAPNISISNGVGNSTDSGPALVKSKDEVRHFAFNNSTGNLTTFPVVPTERSGIKNLTANSTAPDSSNGIRNMTGSIL